MDCWRKTSLGTERIMRFLLKSTHSILKQNEHQKRPLLHAASSVVRVVSAEGLKCCWYQQSDLCSCYCPEMSRRENNHLLCILRNQYPFIAITYDFQGMLGWSECIFIQNVFTRVLFLFALLSLNSCLDMQSSLESWAYQCSMQTCEEVIVIPMIQTEN